MVTKIFGQNPVISIDIESSTIDRMKKELINIDQKVRRRLSRDLRSDLQPIAQDINKAVPGKAPLSGMTPRWGRTNYNIRTFPKGRPGRAIATIDIAGDSAPMNKLLAITERAGSRSRGFTPTGKSMINSLNERYPMSGSGGRFVWKAWMKFRPRATGTAIGILQRFIDETNRQVKP